MANKARCLRSYFLEDGSGKKYYEWAGDSNVAKPTPENQAEGSIFHEVDTATIYAYDEYTTTWYTQIKLGGDGT